MKIPHVSKETWKKLVEASTRFRTLSPWDGLEDDDIFGVKDPKTGEIGWCCVLGAAGEVYALCVYRGIEGLDFYQRLQAGEIDVERDDVFALQNCLMAEFCERGELEKEDLSLLKTSAFKTERDDENEAPAYPKFRSHLPGHAPWHLTEAEANCLTFALECAADVAECLKEDHDVLAEPEPGRFLVYVPKDVQGEESSWIRRHIVPEPYVEPVISPIPLDELKLRKIRERALQPDSAWEADSFYLGGGMILDQDRPYYGRGIMIAHHQSGFILRIDMMKPDSNTYLALAQGLFHAIEKHALLPNELWVRDDNLWEALKPTTDALGIRLRMRRHLRAIFEAKMELAEKANTGFASANKDPGRC